MTMVSAPPPAIASNSTPVLKGARSSLPPLGPPARAAAGNDSASSRLVSASPSASPAPPSLSRDQQDDALVAIPPTLDVALLPASFEAVNHLCAARVRLLATLPSVGTAWSMWCGHCGALREGFGGAAAFELREKSGSATPTGMPMTKKRTCDGYVKLDAFGDADGDADADADADGEDAPVDELERELQRALADMANGRNAPPGITPQRRRKPPHCTMCGAKFRRPLPAPARFAPARQVARTRRQSALAAEVMTDEAEAAAAAAATAASNAPSTTESMPAPSPAVTLARTPSLAHIPTSHPSTPTYPSPPVVPPPSSGGATPTVSIPPGGGVPPAKKRKTKKSGLAKLLVQNAARSLEKGAGGNWGLG